MIKAVVFDMGGVILDIDLERCKVAFRNEVGFTSIDTYIDTYCQKGFWGELEAGKISEEEFVSRCIALSKPGTSREDVIRCFTSFIDGVPVEKAEYINELSERYPLYLLSNTNPVALRITKGLAKEAGLDMDKVFRKLFISYEMKTMKPGHEIYRRAVEGIGLKPEEILFVDDSMRNIEAAQAVGIRGLYYDVRTDLRVAVEEALKA